MAGVGIVENFAGTQYPSVPKKFSGWYAGAIGQKFFLAGTRYPSVPKIFFLACTRRYPTSEIFSVPGTQRYPIFEIFSVPSTQRYPRFLNFDGFGSCRPLIYGPNFLSAFLGHFLTEFGWT